MDDHIKFIERAIELAGQGILSGGGPFGALITKDGSVIAEAFNTVVMSHDSTAHAEIAAIRKAAAALKTHDLSGCTIYTSCEPCPMCLGAIYWSGISCVFYSSTRKDAENAGFSDNFIYGEFAAAPADRKIPFIRLEVTNAGEVFSKWMASEDKISY